MTFIVTLIALVIERFFDWSHLRHWYWYGAYERAVIKRLPSLPSYVLLAIVVIPLLIMVAILQYPLQGLLYGFVSLLFELFILIYCLGPQNLWADVYACINAIAHSDLQSAEEKSKIIFGVVETGSTQAWHTRLLDKIFIASNSRIFAVVFWYVVLGPIGAVLYRSVNLAAPHSAYQEGYPELNPAARTVESILDWIPIRIFTFLFALGGHFVPVLSRWRKRVLSGFENNANLLTECGYAALGREELGELPNDGTAEKNAISLLERVFVIVLVIVAIFVLLV